jgi:hypothetical protein
MRRIGLIALLWGLAACTDTSTKATDETDEVPETDTEPVDTDVVVDTEVVDTEPDDSEPDDTDPDTEIVVDTEVTHTGDTSADTFMPPDHTGIFVPIDSADTDTGGVIIDTETGPPPDTDACDGFRVRDCNNRCFSSFLLGDDICHNGSNPLLPDFDCEEHEFDEGDCILTDTDPEPCTDPLDVNDCSGACYPVTWVGDGQCDDGTMYAHGDPDFNCPTYNLDEGDCAISSALTQRVDTDDTDPSPQFDTSSPSGSSSPSGGDTDSDGQPSP